MDKQFSGWLDLLVRSFIIGFTIYLVVSACFMSDYKRMANLFNALDGRMNAINEQARVISYLGSANNPEALFELAMMDEERGDFNAAAQKVVRTVQLAEFYYNQKYKVKLNNYIDRGIIKGSAR
jgi:hypothetical protein